MNYHIRQRSREPGHDIPEEQMQTTRTPANSSRTLPGSAPLFPLPDQPKRWANKGGSCHRYRLCLSRMHRQVTRNHQPPCAGHNREVKRIPATASVSRLYPFRFTAATACSCCRSKSPGRRFSEDVTGQWASAAAGDDRRRATRTNLSNWHPLRRRHLATPMRRRPRPFESVFATSAEGIMFQPRAANS